MSKKRKTRKQKEASSVRHIAEQTQPLHVHHIHTQAPTYSITGIKNAETPVITSKVTIMPTDTSVAQKDAAYLRHDMTAITAASGIVAAFDILLFVLLSTGFIHLHILGY